MPVSVSHDSIGAFLEAESVIDDNARPGIVRPKKHNRLGASPFNFLAE